LWKEFVSPEGGFTVLFPGAPDRETQSFDIRGNSVTLRIHRLLMPPAEYLVAYQDYPASLGIPNIESLEESIPKSVSPGTKFLDMEKIKLASHPAMLFRERTEDGRITRVKMMFVGQRLYKVSVTIPDEGAPTSSEISYEKMATKFLDSFRLTAGVGTLEQEAGVTLGEVDKLIEENKGGVVIVVGDRKNVQGESKSENTIEGSVIKRPPVEYPANAKILRAQGAVAVKVMVNEQGKVIAAQVESGHPLLRAAALKVARGTEFSPMVHKGKATKVVGIMLVNFTLK